MKNSQKFSCSNTGRFLINLNMYSLKIDEVIQMVKSTGQGLNVSEAKKRFKENGRN